MATLPEVLRRHPVTAYFALTFAISWGGALLAIDGSAGMPGATPTEDPRFIYAVVAMVAGPTVMGLLMTGLVRGREGLHEFQSRLLEWHVEGRWYAVALLAAPVLWTATALTLSIASPTFLPGILTSEDKAVRLLVGLAVAVTAGVLEELGWTGFATPQLRMRHGVVATGLIVGVLWGGWHLLTNVFWASPVTAGNMPLTIFLPISVAGALVGYLTAFRVLMVWVFDKTESLLLAILMHVSLTASVLILDPEQLSGVTLLTYSFALAAAVWLVVALCTTRNRHHIAQQVERRAG